jgi:pSer/pThr/pTyr-binding forkhead associated (FHA) protein
LITSDLADSIALSPPVHVVASWVDEADEPRKRRFAHPFTIGRDGDIALMDKRVSRRHAQVLFTNGAWTVKDLESANGTFLDGERVTEAPIPQSSTLRFHQRGPKVRLRIEDPQTDPH